MSGDEKAIQIGEAVQTYQSAKTECAHIDQKINKVAESYRLVGSSMGFGVGASHEPRIVDGRLKFDFHGVANDRLQLVGEVELRALITERDQARAARDQAKKHMNDLGIVSVD